MTYPSKDTIERLREEYPAGTRVELVNMDDVQAPPVGTKGTVQGVDDTGSLLMKWDNGSGLNVIYGVDSVKKLDTVTTVCYGKKQVWDSRKEAADFFLQAIAGTEGSERDRYVNIYLQLNEGCDVCSDEVD